jgi:predicted thioesterase
MINVRTISAPTQLSPKDTAVMRYITRPEDCVQTAGVGREWSDKPAVVASCVLVRLCEQVCMRALLESMPDGYCSLGVQQQLHHHAPVVVGAEIVLTAHLTGLRDHHTSWHVTVEDRHETVASGRMDFVDVHRTRYETRRLTAKYKYLTIPTTESGSADQSILRSA